MNRLFLYLILSIISINGFSQKVYFIYLQTENDQPFYARMDKSTYSSSASGYLILSKLKDSTYTISVGFPQNKWPEQKFSVAMNKKDHGYLVKNFGEKGWGLFDLQTLAVQMAINGSAKIETSPAEGGRDISAFTNILAKAADDPTLREMQVTAVVAEKGTGTSVPENEKKQTVAEKTEPVIVKTEIPKAETKEPPVKKQEEKTEPVIAKTEDPKTEMKEPPVIKQEEKTEPVITKTEEPKAEIKEQPKTEEVSIPAEVNNYKPSVVIKRSESLTSEGLGLVFVDQDSKGTSDTISLLIPNPKPVVTPKESPAKEEKKFIEILPDSVKAVEEKAVVKEEPRKFYHEMNNCPSLAQNSDFFKLRKLMAAAEGDDNMIAEAKEYFKTKCFTTQQIKNLSSLFLNDAGKYNFFIEGYYHVSDKNSYSLLETELKEEEYLNKFKAMLRN